MATAIFDNYPPDGRNRFPSRLIPGAHAFNGALPRRKAASAAIEAKIWEWPGDLFRPPRLSLWRRIFAAVLPQPATRNLRLGLAMAVVSDFFIILVSFLTCGICFAFFRSSPLSYSAIFPRAGLSTLLLYGTVFTLLGYSERLYQPETIRSPSRECSLLAKVAAWSTAMVVAIFAVSMTPEVPGS